MSLITPKGIVPDDRKIGHSDRGRQFLTGSIPAPSIIPILFRRSSIAQPPEALTIVSAVGQTGDFAALISDRFEGGCPTCKRLGLMSAVS